MSGNSTRTTGALAAAALIAALTGCSGPSVDRDAETQEIIESGTESVFTLRVGDCFNGEGADDEEIADVAAVPCSEPHDDEVFHSFTLPEGEWPGADAILMEAEIECMEQFETFAGIAHEVSALDFYPITPTEPGWNTLDDREILCLIYDFEGQSSGTLKGAGR